MYIYIYVYVSVYAYVCIHIYMHICICSGMNVIHILVGWVGKKNRAALCKPDPRAMHRSRGDEHDRAPRKIQNNSRETTFREVL